MKFRTLLPIIRIFGLLLPVLVCVANCTAHAQTLKTGSVTAFNPTTPCPTDKDGQLPYGAANCYIATVDNCPAHGFGTIPPINAYVAISKPNSWNGSTIFLHSGSDGEDYFNAGVQGKTYAQYYFDSGFQVVQIAWTAPSGQSGVMAGDWHDNYLDPPVKALKFEACRPATLLNYIYQNYQLPSTGAMCAQGHSAGSAAVAYALAWYGASSYLTSVVLTSGPVYSNVRTGCAYDPTKPFDTPITVCPTGQFGCNVGTGSGFGPWSDVPEYLGAASAVAQYTNDPPDNCNNYTGSNVATTAVDNQDWLGMSITSSGASYSYPNTALYAFLCAPNASQNNSAAQGQLFYVNFTSASQTSAYQVYRVNACPDAESIWGGTTPDGNSAFMVSASEMVNACQVPDRLGVGRQ